MAMTELLQSDKALARLTDQALTVSEIALDTEFMRERTYYPQFCLIQAALPQEIALIDVQADLDLGILAPALGGGPVKILHACRQDLEVLGLALAAPLAPLFDTQVAAALCGFAPQCSYAALVSDLLGVDLAKSATRTDWSRRPLSDEQLAYAADDVRYLAPLRHALDARLNALGRRDWMDEEMQALGAVELVANPAEAWQRVKGHQRLNATQRARLIPLAAWRERRAMERDRPRRWIASDELLLEMAVRRPMNVTALRGLPDMPPALVRNAGQDLLEILSAEHPPNERPVAEPPDLKLIKALQGRLRELAAGLELDASLLATRADLVELASGNCPVRLGRGWRAREVTPALRALL